MAKLQNIPQVDNNLLTWKWAQVQ